MNEIGYLVLTYLVAGIPFGVLVSRAVSSTDIRKKGSGNIGATNIARVIGKKWGILVLFLDALKGFVMVAFAKESLEFASLVALVAVFAHCYPVYLKFKGGKGVATALGSLLALSPQIIGLVLVVFVIALVGTRRVSVGSISGALAFPFVIYLMQIPIPLTWTIAMSAIILWKHRENIQRLMSGTEPRFF